MLIDENYYKDQVRKDVGDIGQNAIQEVVFPIEATGGTFTYALSGSVSNPISYPVSSSSVQLAIEMLPSVGVGNVSIVLGRRGFIVEYIGDLSRMNMPMPSVNGSGLTLTSGVTANTVPVQENQKGKENYWSDLRIDEMWSRRSDIGNLERRFLYVKLDAIRELKGVVWTQIDMETGDQKRSFSKQYDHLGEMEKSTLKAMDDLAAIEDSDLLGETYYKPPAIRAATQKKWDDKFGSRCCKGMW